MFGYAVTPWHWNWLESLLKQCPWAPFHSAPQVLCLWLSQSYDTKASHVQIFVTGRSLFSYWALPLHLRPEVSANASIPYPVDCHVAEPNLSHS